MEKHKPRWLYLSCLYQNLLFFKTCIWQWQRQSQHSSWSHTFLRICQKSKTEILKSIFVFDIFRFSKVNAFVEVLHQKFLLMKHEAFVFHISDTFNILLFISNLSALYKVFLLLFFCFFYKFIYFFMFRNVLFFYVL